MNTAVPLPSGKPRLRGSRVPWAIGLGVALVLALMAVLLMRITRMSESASPLSASAKSVSVVKSVSATYRTRRRYMATLQPWIEAKLGPQMVSAYVDTVLVRPGDIVKRGQVVATLDCRNASTSTMALTSQARALQTEQQALAHEAARINELQEGGFASPNEIERKVANSASKQSELEAWQARLARASLEVSDCVIRAPFSGEITDRFRDPGAFVRPGDAIATIIDRGTVRVVAEVPESDFELVAPETPVNVHVLATNDTVIGHVNRRSPAANVESRTVSVEVDLNDTQRKLPVGTSAELLVESGEAVPALEIPVVAAVVRNGKASLYYDDHGVARKRVLALRGEREGSLFVEPALPEGAHIVTEGRSSLRDGDKIQAVVIPSDSGAVLGHRGAL